MAEFTIRAEIMFSSPTWTDVSSYVRVAEGISITRGRGDEQSDIQTGTASLTLDNRDGRFTPGLASGAYYPNVRKNVPIRIGVVISGTTYWRFYGFVNEWPVAWDGGTVLTTSSITCSDMFKRLGLQAPMRSLLEEEMLALDPDVYYPLSEPGESTSAGDISGNEGKPMVIAKDDATGGDRGTITFAATEGPGVDGLPAVQFLTGPAPDPERWSEGKHLEAPIPAGSGSIVMACWFAKDGPEPFPAPGDKWKLLTLAANQKTDVANPDEEATQFEIGMLGEDGVLPGLFVVLAHHDGTPNLDNGEPETAWSHVDFNDGQSHFVAVLVQSNGNVTLYADGTLGGFTLNFSSTVRTSAYRRLLVGGGTEFSTGFSGMFDGTISHVWLARRATMPDWTYVWQAGGQATVPLVDRFNRLCTLMGIAGAVLGSTPAQIDAQAAGGRARIEALQDVARVEGGLLYASRSTEEIVLECVSHRYNKAPSVTLTDADIQGDLVWSDDDQFLVNDMTTQRGEGAQQRVLDQASIDTYGIYTGSETQPWATDEDALGAAQWAVYKGADPPPRVSQVTVIANALPSHTAILELEISDVIRLTGLPSTSPATSVDLHVEGYSEAITFNEHSISFNTSPADVNEVWQLQVPGRSELGVTTRFGY